MFDDFHKNGSFVKSLNVTFLVLIAKRVGAKNIRAFRSISRVEVYL